MNSGKRKYKINKYQYILIFIFLGVFGLAKNSLAAPTISGVTGTIATGQTLTITGSSLMNENKSSWQSAYVTGPNAGFEGTDLTGWNQDWFQDSENSTAVVYDTTVKLMGNKSAKAHIGGIFPDHACSGIWTNPPSSTNYYVRFYTRYNWASNLWPDNYIKLWYDHTNFYFAPNLYALNSGVPYQWGFKVGGIPYFSDNPSGTFQKNRWYCIEIHVNEGHHVDAWVDGTQIFNMDTSMTHETYDVFLSAGIPNSTASSNASLSIDNWWDAYAVSSARIHPASIVEISGDNGLTWTYQPPTSLSETSIAITAGLPTLTAANYILRVTDNQQNVSSTYTLGSGGGDTTPPSMPSGLSVS